MKLSRILGASASLVVLSATALADVVDNPGQVTFTLQAGSSATVGTAPPLSFGGMTPATLSGQVASDGTMTIAAADIGFQPIQLMIGTFSVTVTPQALTDGAVTINPVAGNMTASMTIALGISGFLIPDGCQVGPVSFNFTSAAGTPYDMTTGNVAITDNTFTVPASSGCGLVGAVIDSQFGLPSGTNTATLVLSTNPILTGS